MEAGQLSQWLSGLTMQGLEQVSVVCVGPLWPALIPTRSLSVGHRTRKPSPNLSSGELETLV